MSAIAKPKSVWWRTQAGTFWHENVPADPYFAKVVAKTFRGWSLCGKSGEPYKTRRSDPPVADQCAKCRAAKARQRKEKVSK